MKKVVVALLAVFILGAWVLTSTVQSAPTTLTGTVPPPPPPPPGGTPTPRLPPCPPTGIGPNCPPTVTPVPPTATAIPLSISVTVAHSSVTPPSKQKVMVTTLPGATVTIVAHFPNGDSKKRTVTVGATGSATWTYIQPGSRITPASRLARVSASAELAGQSVAASKTYTIAYARLDLAVQPRSQKRSKSVTVWAHVPGSSTTKLVVTYRNHLSQSTTIKNSSGARKWARFGVLIPGAAAKGRADVAGFTRAPGFTARAYSSFQVK